MIVYKGIKLISNKDSDVYCIVVAVMDIVNKMVM